MSHRTKWRFSFVHIIKTIKPKSGTKQVECLVIETGRASLCMPKHALSAQNIDDTLTSLSSSSAPCFTCCSGSAARRASASNTSGKCARAAPRAILSTLNSASAAWYLTRDSLSLKQATIGCISSGRYSMQPWWKIFYVDLFNHSLNLWKV